MTDRSSVVDSYTPGHGNRGYQVESYFLDLTYRVSSDRLSGTATIEIRPDETLSRVILDLAGLTVSKVLIDGAPAKKFTLKSGKLSIVPATSLQPDRLCALQISYKGNPKPQRSPWGPLGWEELTDGALVASQPTGASSWFPCNDHPSSKASYRFQITTDSPYTVLANGALISRHVGGSLTTWLYEQREPMASYLATIHISQAPRVTLGERPISQTAVVPTTMRPKFDRDFARQSEMITLFERRFGPYPFASGYHVVITADPLEIPLESRGFSTLWRQPRHRPLHLRTTDRP